MSERKHYLREGDKVKANTGVAGFHVGATGKVKSTDGQYVYVKMDVSPAEVEYYREELDLVEAASDSENKKVRKAEARKIIKIQEKSIEESKEIIEEMQKILDS